MKLNAAGCACAVGVQVNVALKPQRNIHGKLSVKLVHALGALPQGFNRLGRINALVKVLNQSLNNVLGHNARAGEVSPAVGNVSLVGVVAAEKFVDTLA